MPKENQTTLRLLSEDFEPPSKGQISAVFCVRNEAFRLPFFLDYYRRLGVERFFAVDNGSTDETQAVLLAHPDVHVFYTDQPYKESNAGRDWTSWLANQYCLGHWVLTLDVDEFLLYPFAESVSLTELTKYLDHSGYQGLFSIFLDFYSKGLLSEAIYYPKQSPFEVCNYFDSPTSYVCYEREIFPHFEIKGGPRKRLFWPGGDRTVGPSMRKLVLVKWSKGFSYTHSTHSCTPLKLADITGVVAHFKLLSRFKQHATEEVKRDNRIANSVDWKAYKRVLDEKDPVFFDPHISLEYKGTHSLIDGGLMRSTLRFDTFCRTHCNHPQAVATQTPANGGVPHADYHALTAIWPAVSAMSREFQFDAGDHQSLLRFERDMDIAVSSRTWRSSYYFRKLASKIGLTDQRSLTEENFYNQTIHARFTFTYKSIWWDLLAPFRVVYKVFRRLRRKSN